MAWVFCVAVCCSVLQCVAVCCSVLQCMAWVCRVCVRLYSACLYRHVYLGLFVVQPIVFGVVFGVYLVCQRIWISKLDLVGLFSTEHGKRDLLFNRTWQKRPIKLDHRLRFEIEVMTLHMQLHLVLQHFVLQCVAVCCSVLQCVAVCCSVLQCVAVCCSMVQLHVECHDSLLHLAVPLVLLV